MRGTVSSATSTPKSPRATITPSASCRMASMFSQACGFSILATMGSGPDSMPRSASRKPCTSAAVRTKESATISMPCATPKHRSPRSFSVSERRRAYGHARQIDALVIANRPAGDHFRAHRWAADGDHAQFDGAIGQQHPVAGFYVGGEIEVSGGGAPAIAQERLGGDGEDAACFERAAAARKSAEADLGRLQVEENAGGAAQFRGDLADGGKARGGPGS